MDGSDTGRIKRAGGSARPGEASAELAFAVGHNGITFPVNRWDFAIRPVIVDLFDEALHSYRRGFIKIGTRA